MSSTLDVIIQDPKIKEIYLEKDREKLYNHVDGLFEELKIKYGITHWYFILPNGHTFLRIHNKEIYNDEITRFTFENAKKTKSISSGIELGKTAYALRVVVPYYDKGEFIGYIELGQEIDHFLGILKEETENEFMLVANKRYLNEDKWAFGKDIAGLRNNWDDLKDYVVLEETSEGKDVFDCFTDSNMEEGKRGGILFQEIEGRGKFYRCIGIPLIDAEGIQSGVILSLINISSYKAFIHDSDFIILGFLVLIFVLIILMNYLLFGIRRKKK
jgi:hypothetical protein